VAVIERGTWSNQRTVVGELGGLTDLIDANEIRAPALIVVGEVVRLHRELDWVRATVGPISATKQ
jgi:siroheme synthase